MAEYGMKEARINKQRHTEEDSCGSCGTPVPRHEVLCKECRITTVPRNQIPAYA